jgi:sortase A
VISGHRGLPTAALFTDLDKVVEGDVFILLLGKDHYLAYQVFQISVIEPTDLSKLEKDPNNDLVTLLTCTPYMVNSHRLLVTGERIPFTPSMLGDIENSEKIQILQRYLMFGGIVLVIVLAIWHMIYAFYRMRIRRRKYDVLVHVFEDEESPVPYQGAFAYALYDKKGKHPIKRKGEPIQARLNPENSQLFMEQLPGLKYRIKPTEENPNLPSFSIRVKRMKHQYFRLSIKGGKNRKAGRLKIKKDHVQFFIKKGR